MKRVILYFILLLGAVWLGAKIYHNPGYILILYQNYAIETTTWVVCLIILLTFLLLHLLYSLIRGTISFPAQIGNWWQQRSRRLALKRFNKGFQEFIAGRGKKAEKNLVKSAKEKDLAFVSYALAAKVADEQHYRQKRDKYLLLAQMDTPKNKDIVTVMQAQFMLKNNQPDEALSLLLKLREAHPRNPSVLKLTALAYMKLNDWFHLQTLLKDLKKNKIYPEEQYLEIEKLTYLKSLRDHYFADFSEIQSLWNKLPKYLRHDPQILVAYSNQLKRWNRSAEAETLLRKELKNNFNNEVMECYVTTHSEQPAKQLALGEKCLKENTEEPQTLRAMGMLCLRNRLWGQAKDYFEASLKIHPDGQAYTALGFVYEKLGEKEKALYYYRKGLNHLSSFSI